MVKKSPTDGNTLKIDCCRNNVSTITCILFTNQTQISIGTIPRNQKLIGFLNENFIKILKFGVKLNSIIIFVRLFKGPL